MLDANEILELEKKLERHLETKRLQDNKYLNFIKNIDKKFVIAIAIISVAFAALTIYGFKEPSPKDDVIALKNKMQEAKKRYETDSIYSLDYDNYAELNQTHTPQGWLYFNEISSQKQKPQEASNKVLQEEFLDLNDSQAEQDESNKTKVSKNSIKAKLQISDTDLNIADLEKKFNTDKNAHTAVLIAKRYFEKKQYKKSEKWALVANELDELNEESWIIFARSKYRQNKKDDAIKILQAYNQNANSLTVTKWIERMRE